MALRGRREGREKGQAPNHGEERQLCGFLGHPRPTEHPLAQWLSSVLSVRFFEGLSGQDPPEVVPFAWKGRRAPEGHRRKQAAP